MSELSNEEYWRRRKRRERIGSFLGEVVPMIIIFGLFLIWAIALEGIAATR